MTTRTGSASLVIATRWFGAKTSELAAVLDVPALHVYESVSSTLDVAHQLAAEGAAAGTLILAEEQTEGRGRNGATWQSARGSGIWLTMIGRPRSAEVVDVLALRVGIRASQVLDRFTSEPVRLKWPNDLWLSSGKLGGILAEARWRGDRPEWLALGMGINLVSPNAMTGASLVPGTPADEVLAELVPAIRAAMTATGPLTPAELKEFATRDLAAGRRFRMPLAGIARGISVNGELVVETPEGTRAVRAGSLVLEDA